MALVCVKLVLLTSADVSAREVYQPPFCPALLFYLEAKFASLMSYGLTVELLSEILPIGHPLNTTSVRREVWRIAERAESELGEEQWSFIEGCQRDWDRLPRPGPPLTVGLDGGYVHAREQRSRAEG